MLRRALVVPVAVALALLVGGCGGQGEANETPETPPAPSWTGDWTRAIPVERSVPINITFRLRPGGNARLLFQNGPARPFVDRRGHWTQGPEGGMHTVTLRTEDGGEENFEFEIRHPTLTLHYPFRDDEKIVFTR